MLCMELYLKYFTGKNKKDGEMAVKKKPTVSKELLEKITNLEKSMFVKIKNGIPK